MSLWRISKYEDLGGRGGLTASGRWHTRPQSIVYCSDDPRTAYSEVLKHVGHPSLLPDDDKLLEIAYPASMQVEVVDSGKLDALWSSDAFGWRVCRPIGDEWLRSGRTALLKVPSAARLGSFNYLINPAVYGAADIEILAVVHQPFEPDVTG